MKIQVLVTPGCGHGSRAHEIVAGVVAQVAPEAEVNKITITTLEDAARWSFPGSPTIRADGIDIDPEAPVGVGLG